MAIVIENLTYIYDKGSPYETKALDNVSLKIDKGEFIGLIGHTGSGKSTLIQHMNGLLKPTSGKIVVDGMDITEKGVKLSDIRKKVGLVFQYPEYQLFEETVERDIAFGPKNLGWSEEIVKQHVDEAVDLVGLDRGLLQLSPFALSGGQKRRVAIAGVLAMNPQVFILDEPTAGLDPKGRDEILEQIQILHKKKNMTVVLVSHSMEDIAKIADRLIVMDGGKIDLEGSPRDVFKHATRLEQIGLGVPQITKLFHRLHAKDDRICDDVITIEDAKETILKLLRGTNA